MHAPDLTGPDFERWLFDKEHRTLPDFLVMPEITFGPGLLKQDIHALRTLASAQPGTRVPTHMLAGMARLHAHGIIERLTTPEGALYVLSPYSFEVLLHNVSFRR